MSSKTMIEYAVKILRNGQVPRPHMELDEKKRQEDALERYKQEVKNHREELEEENKKNALRAQLQKNSPKHRGMRKLAVKMFRR